MLRRDADAIIAASIEAVKPDAAVVRALKDFVPGSGRTLLIAAGKAAWQMARAAVAVLLIKNGNQIPGRNCIPDGK